MKSENTHFEIKTTVIVIVIVKSIFIINNFV